LQAASSGTNIGNIAGASDIAPPKNAVLSSRSCSIIVPFFVSQMTRKQELKVGSLSMYPRFKKEIYAQDRNIMMMSAILCLYLLMHPDKYFEIQITPGSTRRD
jgi:hypothetical protein